jgi:hypothetical protein
VATPTLLGAVVVLTLISVSLVAVAAFSLYLATFYRVTSPWIEDCEVTAPKEPEPTPAKVGPGSPARVLHCSSCRSSVRRGGATPRSCSWCDRCEADTLCELVVTHASSDLEVIMARRLRAGHGGRTNLVGLRNLVANCYRAGLGA